MAKKTIQHFSVTDIVRKRFSHARSRGVLGKDLQGNTYFYGVTIKGEDFITQILFVGLDHEIHQAVITTLPSLQEAEQFVKNYKETIK
jgi:hypothetical protein